MMFYLVRLQTCLMITNIKKNIYSRMPQLLWEGCNITHHNKITSVLGNTKNYSTVDTVEYNHTKDIYNLFIESTSIDSVYLFINKFMTIDLPVDIVIIYSFVNKQIPIFNLHINVYNNINKKTFYV